CLEAQAEATALLERLGKAKRRDALQAQLADAKAEARRAAGPRSTGRGLMLAAATGGDASTIEKWLAAAMSVLKIALLETLVYLSIPGATLLGQAWAAKAPKVSPAAVRKSTSAPKPAGPRGGQRQARPEGGKVVALRPETATINKMAAHGLTQQQIAKALGVSRSTVQRRMAAARRQDEAQAAVM
ncbi:MAG: helix-turn-helix domain-containing protein, partial [Alphaproteobacteria bacterium]